MSRELRPFVLAVCGPSGAGKSTLIEELADGVIKWIDTVLI